MMIFENLRAVNGKLGEMFFFLFAVASAFLLLLLLLLSTQTHSPHTPYRRSLRTVAFPWYLPLKSAQ